MQNELLTSFSNKASAEKNGPMFKTYGTFQVPFILENISKWVFFRDEFKLEFSGSSEPEL